jgi:hypothetical protein
MTPAGPRSLAVANGKWGLPAMWGLQARLRDGGALTTCPVFQVVQGLFFCRRTGVVEGPSSSPTWDEISASPHRVQGSSFVDC